MTITAREIHLAIKKGLTTAELAEKYDITPEDLLDYIRTRMNAGAKDLIRELQKNDKKRRKKNEDESETSDTEVITSGIIVLHDDDETETVSCTQTPTLTMPGKISALKESETEFSNELMELERAHEAMAQRRRQILEKAKEINEKISKIQGQLLEAEQEIEDLALEYDVLADDMTTNTHERRGYEDLLEEIRSEIDALSNVTAVIRFDGSIECSNPEFLETLTAESESDELSKLMAMPEAEDFTLRQLKGIAKGKLLSQIGVSVTFEIPEVQNLI